MAGSHTHEPQPRRGCCCSGGGTVQGGTTDPVCGMMVDPAKPAPRAEHGAQTYYFCCAGCRATLTNGQRSATALHSRQSNNRAAKPRSQNRAVLATAATRPV